jgi:hypothetical protein
MKNPLSYLRRGGEYENTNADEGDEMTCERLVKNYDGKSIQIAGLNFGGFELGKLGIEPKLLQTVSHALMLLDASQYDLCTSIKNMRDKDTREKYIRLMTDDKLAAQRIYRALAGLLINPQSTQMQDTVKDTLLSSLKSTESRVADLENSNLLSKVQQQQQQQQLPPPTSSLPPDHTTTTQSPIEIGNTSFKERIDDLKQSYAEISNDNKQQQKSIESSSTVGVSKTVTTVAQDEKKSLKKELEDIDSAIVALNNEYTNSLIKGLNVVEFWDKLGGVLQQLTADIQYRKAIGSTNAEALDRIVIKIAAKVNEFKEADDLGNTIKASIAKKEIMLYFGQVFRRMDDIYSSI